MATMNTIGFVLFAGILGSQIVHGLITNQEHNIAGSFFTRMKTPQYIELLKQECEINGGPDAYANIERNDLMVHECYAPLSSVSGPGFGGSITPKKNVGLESSTTLVCHKIPDVKNCIDKSTDPIKACYEPKYRGNFNISHNTRALFLDFICENDGHVLKEFLANGGLACSKSKKTGLEDCIRKMYDDYASNGDIESRKLPAPYSIEECIIKDNVHYCVVETLRECWNSPGDVVDSIFEFIKRNTPCGNVLDSQYSHYSSSADGNVVSIAGLTAIMMTAMQFT